MKELNYMNKRIAAGRRGKIGGHNFERAFAKKYNLSEESIEGGGRTKVDIRLPSYNLSLKNPLKSHTQVALISPQSWLKTFNVTENFKAFIFLFFGLPNMNTIRKICCKHEINFSNLDYEQEIKRQRLLASSLPEKLRVAGLNWFNGNPENVFDALFVSGINQTDSVDILGWAWIKNEVNSVKFYKLNLIREDFIRGSHWSVSSTNSTLWCNMGGEKILHLQMKGSGKPKYISWGYHGMMFHMYNTLLKEKYELTENIAG